MKFRKAKKHIFLKIFFVILIVAVCFRYAEIIRYIAPHNETYSGSYSEQTYSTIAETIQAYVSNELEGTATTVDYYDYKIVTKGSSAVNESVAYAESGHDDEEQVLVTFYCGDESYSVYMNVCYLQDNSMRYWVPAPTTGEVITKSYFESVLDKDNYSNYTINYRQSGEIDIYSVPIKITTNATLKLADDYGYYAQGVSFLGSSVNTKLYMKDSKSGLLCYGKIKESYSVKAASAILKLFGVEVDENETDYENESDYQSYTLSNIWGTCSSLSDFARVGFPEGIDHTFFVKTTTGFAVNPSKKEAFTQIMVKSLGDMMNMDSDTFDQIMELTDASFDASYVVYDGRISKMVMKKTIAMNQAALKNSMSENNTAYQFLKNYKVSVSVEALYTDFGSTKIDVPSEVEALF